MSERPVILVTCGRSPQEAPRYQVQSLFTGIDTDYVDSIAAAGGAPVILPCVADLDAVRRVVGVCDGLVLTGGGDVVSQSYGEEPHASSKYQDPVRDEVELEVTKLALSAGLPILAICRGIQLLNVALGGTLIQDVPSQVSGAIQHYSRAQATILLHSVDVDEGTLLERVLGTRELRVNSWHHQAVGTVGRGLRVSARARDGVIEGVESDDGRPVLGVQWHPEELASDHEPFANLFAWVVEESGSRPRAQSGRAVAVG